MPVRNASPFLTAGIDSILAQTESNWELIAINDHSTDHSNVILESYSRLDDRIQLYQNTGSGIIPALRRAFRAAKGKLITRMDADDIMKPLKLSVLKSQLLKNGPGHIAIGLVEYISESGVGPGYLKYQEWLNELSRHGHNFMDLYRECVIPSPCWMVYRKDLETCLSFEPGRYPEDYDLCFRFFQHGLKCIPATETLHEWRDHPNRASRNDPNYSDNTFLDLKMFWFLKLHYQNIRPLIVWGAGKKGKSIAKLLMQNDVTFSWICNNEKKIGRDVFGVQMQAIENLDEVLSPQIIISVANPKDQKEILDTLIQKGLTSMNDYFLFC
jgi:glycosyltransferase involved in cell wall biosynthesis